MIKNKILNNNRQLNYKGKFVGKGRGNRLSQQYNNTRYKNIQKKKVNLVKRYVVKRKYEQKNFILRKVIMINCIKKRYFVVRKGEFMLLHFLGRKFKYDLRTRLVDVMDCIFGVSIKRFILFFLSYYGYSINCLLMMSPIEIFQDLHRKIRFLFVNFELRKYIRNNIAIKLKYRLYSGIRASLLLPSRGQRSKTNAGTIKRLRRMSGKKKK